jgi:two-component system chemotaxis sensor kinase CheA
VIVSMEESEIDSEFFAGFLDDYFAECEEHLIVARRALLSLEASVNRPQADRALLDELFRSFHSLKGISGMVGAREAERVAHEMEGYLRAMRQGGATLTPEGLDALIAGVKTLEAVVSAHRHQTPPPDIDPVLARLAGVTSAENAPSESPSGPPPDSLALSTAPAAKALRKGLSEEEGARLEAARRNGLRIWRFEFSPSAELAGRGVGVGSVRERLQGAGELIHAAPLITSLGGVTFEFIVASAADDAEFVAWREDGLSYELYEPPQSAPTAVDNGGARSPAQGSSRAPAHVVRVDLQRLDELMRMVGELVISRSHLENKLNRIESSLPPAEWRSLQETNLAIERQLRDLREGIMQARMVPVGEIFERMQFVIRDLARESGKQVRLEMSGQETEIDKYLVERMTDPLLHLVRNAVSHGLEAPDERRAAGKEIKCRVSLRAFTSGETVVIIIEDDGRGIDREFVAARAREAGLLPAGMELGADELLDVICAPGFSTREEADRASGRGIGMAVVQRTVLELGGSLALDTRVGRGTRFTIELPLTLAIADAMIARVCGQTFAIPQSAVREVIEIDPAAIRALENNEILPYRGGVLPLVRLKRFFGLAGKESRTLHAFVVGSASNPLGLVVDKIVGQREIVVRAMTDPLVQVPGVAGATELGDGRAVLILDAAALARGAAGHRRAFGERKRIEEGGGQTEAHHGRTAAGGRDLSNAGRGQ